jgi:hypothetical protein
MSGKRHKNHKNILKNEKSRQNLMTFGFQLTADKIQSSPRRNKNESPVKLGLNILTQE